MVVSPNPQRASIGVLVKTFPKLSETFVLQELLALESRGLKLALFALQPATDRVLHAHGAALEASVAYLPKRGVLNIPTAFLTHLHVVCTRPRRYLRALRFVKKCARDLSLHDLTRALWLGNRLRRAGVEHLYVHFISEPAGIAELVRLVFNVAFSISAHAKDIYLTDVAVLARRIDAASFVTTCTKYNHRYLSEESKAATPIVCLYHGVDMRRFVPGLESDRDALPLILSVGRLREKKGFDTLITAFSRLRERNLNFKAQIVGYGPMRAKLLAMIDALDIEECVALVEPLPHDDLIALYRRASLFVLPCQVEENGDRDGIPNVLLEAMAMELPVITTAVSGIPEAVVEDSSGLFVPCRDPDALAKAIQRVLDDRDLARRLGRQGRLSVAAGFDCENGVTELCELLARDNGCSLESFERVAALSNHHG